MKINKKYYDRGSSDSEHGYVLNFFQAFVVCGIYVFDYFEGVEADRFYNHR
jgi:hypothetical protein